MEIYSKTPGQNFLCVLHFRDGCITSISIPEIIATKINISAVKFICDVFSKVRALPFISLLRLCILCGLH